MRKTWIVVLVLALVAGSFLGCAQVKKASSSSAAIEASKALQTAQDKVNYLVEQAKAFYNSKEFQQAVDIAQYILAKVDQNSVQAKQILQDAKAKLQAAVDKAAADVKQKLNVLGK